MKNKNVTWQSSDLDLLIAERIETAKLRRSMNKVSGQLLALTEFGSSATEIKQVKANVDKALANHTEATSNF